MKNATLLASRKETKDEASARRLQYAVVGKWAPPHAQKKQHKEWWELVNFLGETTPPYCSGPQPPQAHGPPASGGAGSRFGESSPA